MPYCSEFLSRMRQISVSSTCLSDISYYLNSRLRIPYPFASWLSTGFFHPQLGSVNKAYLGRRSSGICNTCPSQRSLWIGSCSPSVIILGPKNLHWSSIWTVKKNLSRTHELHCTKLKSRAKKLSICSMLLTHILGISWFTAPRRTELTPDGFIHWSYSCYRHEKYFQSLMHKTN